MLSRYSADAPKAMASNRGRAGFKAMRRGLNSLWVSATLDHFAAVKGFHVLEDFLASIKHPHAGGSAHLMARKGQEIAIELANVERPVARALCRIDERGHTGSSGPGADLRSGIDCSQSVGDMREGEDLDGPIEESVEIFQLEQAVRADRDEAKPRALSMRQKLPWHEIAVVFHLREENDVTPAYMGLSPRADNQIDALGRSPGENDRIFFGANIKASRFLALS